MKLLLDQNLSPRLVSLLSDLYPESDHVSKLQLDQVEDADVWEYARFHDYLVVSKDSDFNELSLQRGFPPKVIWIRRGNCSTKDLEKILRAHFDLIGELVESESLGILMLY